MAPRSINANVEPSVLTWARNAAGYELDDVARRLKVDPQKLEAWESGQENPTISRLRKLAILYKRPIASFFLDEPPSEPPLPKDFRSLDPTQEMDYPPELILAIRKARWTKDLARELTHSLRENPPGTDLPTINSNFTPEEAGEALRDDLGISVEDQAEWKNSRLAYDKWMSALEQRRVLVLVMRNVEMETARAFSLTGNPFSAIVVNSKDSWNGRIFSIFHEYCHLASNDSGVCDLSERVSSGSRINTEEVFCNHTAGAFLVPRSALLETPEIREARATGDWTNEQVTSVAQRFSVSYEVILRRMTTLDIVSIDTYRTIHAELKAKYRDRKEKKKSGWGPTPPVQAILDNGIFFTSLVLEGVAQQRIPRSNIRDLLGVYPKHFDEIQRMIGEKLVK